MFSRLFWLDAAERAIKTMAQAVLTIQGVGDELFNIIAVNWKQTLSLAVSAGVISLLMSIASASRGVTSSASLVVETNGTK